MSSIFVAKLDFGVSDEELTGLFQEHGTVVKAHIAKDKETGKPRGFAFVEMSSNEESLRAISALDGRSINGREIVVKLAEDRSGNKPAPRSSSDRPPRADSSAPAYIPPAPRSDSPFQNESDDSPSIEALKPSKRGKGSKKKSGGGISERPESRENKMSAYKKSGKNNKVQFDDDDDWELEFRKSQKSGWTDEEED